MPPQACERSFSAPTRAVSVVLTHCQSISGAKLRIVNTALAVGARIMSARTEASFFTRLGQERLVLMSL
jgi:hypothetical protein